MTRRINNMFSNAKYSTWDDMRIILSYLKKGKGFDYITVDSIEALAMDRPEKLDHLLKCFEIFQTVTNQFEHHCPVIFRVMSQHSGSFMVKSNGFHHITIDPYCVQPNYFIKKHFGQDKVGVEYVAFTIAHEYTHLQHYREGRLKTFGDGDNPLISFDGVELSIQTISLADGDKYVNFPHEYAANVHAKSIVSNLSYFKEAA